jgi:hypothetical protein
MHTRIFPRRFASATLVHGRVYRFGQPCLDTLASGHGAVQMRRVVQCAQECVLLGAANVAWRYYSERERYRASRLLASQGKHWLASLLVSLPLVRSHS